MTRFKGKGALPALAALLLAVALGPVGCAGTQETMRGSAAAEPFEPTGPIVLAEAVTGDLTLSGEVTVSEDLLIPAGVTLTLLPGTDVSVIPSEGTRTDSQFVTTETEILVRGTLSVPEGPVAFRPAEGDPGGWGGIVMTSPSSTVALSGAEISGAQFGLLALAGRTEVTGTSFTGNEVGMAAAPAAEVSVSANRFRDNDIASAAWHSDSPLAGDGDRYGGNGDDALALSLPPVTVDHLPILPFVGPQPPVTREYLGEIALDQDTTWSGTVVIAGQVAVPEGITLTVEPGTHVLFSLRDTNGDGMGESWIIVQGTIRVLGGEDEWVLFDSEDEGARPGAWDSLSLIASDSEDNLIRNAVFRRGVKAFHSHFSRARLDHVVFEDNLRGVQFQESEGTVIDWALLRRNQSGMRFRDSAVTLTNIVAEDNVAGINFLRSTVDARDLVVTGSLTESLVSRESETSLTRAVVAGNVRGPRFKGEGERVRLIESVVAGNLTEGLSFNQVTAMVDRSGLIDNGFTGLSVTDAEVTVRRSRISGNGRYAVDNNGSTEVDASGNDWGTGGPPSAEAIYDGDDQEGIGRVLTGTPARFTVAFPGMPIPSGAYSGEMLVAGDVYTGGEEEVTLLPGARILFSSVPTDSLFDLCSDHPSFPSSELMVPGLLRVEGTAENPVRFGPLQPSGTWGGLNLLGGRGSEIRHAVFTGAATGIHAREAGTVLVEDSRFEDNEVGMRFSRSRVTIRRNLFAGNRTGMRFHAFGGAVENNTFTGNATAVFVTDNPVDVLVRDNTFDGSDDYHVKLGIHVTEDVTVEGGDFRVPAGMRTADLIFDREDDEDLGRVLLKP